MSNHHSHPGHDAIASSYPGHFVHTPYSTVVLTPLPNHPRDLDSIAGPTNTDHEHGDEDTLSKPLPPSILAKRARQHKPPGYVRPNAIWVTEVDGSKRAAKAIEFKEDIIERSQRGETCDQISDALAARGVAMSGPSVGRWRLAWGISKRAKRKKEKVSKPRPQNATKKPYRGRKVQLQTKHKGEIALMTSQGLFPEEIAKVMQSRGMDLKKGATTILRLQTAWGLVEPNLHQKIKNARHLARRKANEQQRKEFRSYAQELQLGDDDAWVERKMAEPAAKKLKDDLALKMLETMAPPGGWPAGSLRLGRPRGGKDSPTNDADGARRGRTRRGASSTNDDNEMHEDECDSSADSDSDIDAGEMSRVRPAQSARHELGLENGRASDADDCGDDTDFASMMLHEDPSGSSDDGARGHEMQSLPDVSLHAVTTTDPALDCDALVSLLLPNATDPAMCLHMVSSADKCMEAASYTKALLTAKLNGTPLIDSVTGLPPSQADVDAAKARLREAAKRILEAF